MRIADTSQNGGTEDESPPIVHPEIQLIDGLFQKIEKGKLRIPAFQRPFVWKPDDMIKLFESIQRGYPIGSLLLWETNGSYESRDEIGPIKLHAQPEKPITYVLDGQQRLSTLFGTLRLPPELAQRDDPALWIWRMYYDLETQSFTHARSGQVAAHFLPLRAVLRTSDYLRFTRALSEQLKDRSEEFLERADRLVQQIAAYRFSVTRIEGGLLAEAVEIFSRLNSRGRPMQPDEMVSALTYREGGSGFHLARRVDEILENLTPFGFGDTSRVLIFRTIIAAAGQDVIQRDWMKAVRSLGDTLPETVNRTERAMLRAADFLAGDIGIPGEPLLPYGYQFVLLSHFFGNCETSGVVPSRGQLDLLTRLFWATSFSGWFAGANSTQIKDALDAMEQVAHNSGSLPPIFKEQLKQPARPFPDRFDLHGARVRTLILTVIHRLRPQSLDGQALEKDHSTWTSDRRRLPKIFRNLTSDLSASPANRLFLPSESDASIGTKRLIELPDSVRDAVLRSHGIVDESLDALMTGDAARFIQARTHYLAKIEREFMAELGLIPPTTEIGATEIDTGDE